MTTDKLTFFGIIAIISSVMIWSTTSIAFGQFSVNPSFDSVSYTSDEIAQGKTAHLNDKQQTIITSGSMLPLFEIGEYVTLDYSVPYSELKAGDIVAFTPRFDIINCDTGLGCDLVMHRIVELDNDSFTTKGDNNDITIAYLERNVHKNQYVGKVIEEQSFA